MLNYALKDENAILFEAGYSCDNAIFLRINNDKFFITDARYGIEASELVKPDVAVIVTDNLIRETRRILRHFKVKSLVFDPFEFSVADFDALRQKLNINFKKKAFFSQKSRICKREDEIEHLRHAAVVGAKCFDEFGQYLHNFGEGKSEKQLHTVACEIFSDRGNIELSFSPIFAINQNAAKAHALASDVKLKRGDLVLLDAGVRIGGYCSDRTRTAYFGDNFSFAKEQTFKNQKMQEIYNIVFMAQKKAIESVKEGVKASFVDSVARKEIAANGYEKQFFHSTGHGVGIDIHELPRISSKDDTILRKGMVFSVEPGIYLQDEFGVRIEDVVVVTENGADIL